MMIKNSIFTFVFSIFFACSPETAVEEPVETATFDLSTLPASAVVRPKNPDNSDHQVVAHLLLDKQQLRARRHGAPRMYLLHDEGWHTYWKSNVEVGQPTDIVWSLPEGMTHTDYAYPIPERFDTQDIISFGYDKEVLLFTTITVPPDMPPGRSHCRPLPVGSPAK